MTLDLTTKFVNAGNVIRYLYRENGSSYTNYRLRPLYIGVNDFDGFILVGPSLQETINQYGLKLKYIDWSGAIIIPADLFYLGVVYTHYNIGSLVKKGSALYAVNKGRDSLGSTNIYQNINSTNDYLLSGTNAIGDRTGIRDSYDLYGLDRVTKTRTYIKTSDYVHSDDHEFVPITGWENSSIYISDLFGRFENNSGTKIEVGYAQYAVLLDEGGDTERYEYPKKYVDIIFSEVDNKWYWKGYSTTNEPVDDNFTMTNDNNETIELFFYRYSFKEQQSFCFDEGGVK